MKAKTLLMIEAGVAVAALTMVVALSSTRAASEPAAAGGTTPPAQPAATEPAPAATEPPIVPALVPPPMQLSPGMDDVIQLARSGVTEDVLVAFIEKSGRAYNPSAEEIIYLKDLGVAPAAIARLIRTGDRDSALAKKIEAGQFEGLEAPAATTNVETVEADGKTTVNVSTKVYAAAPQPVEGAQAAVDVSAEAGASVDLNQFKESLSPYGTWVNIPGYGECWRPTVAVTTSDWRPYYDGGRWVYTNCGWYWLSDYSWGWAPFHYGRWYQDNYWGWVWTPGYTWGPAWVEWRTTSAYCGWAPLPPYYGAGFGVSYWGGSWGFSLGWSSYCWVPYRYCHGYYPRHYAYRGNGRECYDGSTVVRPTININGNNNTVIVTGPDATVVANAGRTEIRRVNIRDVDARGTTGPREYVENGGRTIAAYRPGVRPERNAPEVALANSRSEFRRPATIKPTTTEAPSVTAAEAANPRNIVLRGTEPNRQSDSSYSTWRAATTTRTPGQNTTLNPAPEYRRPATEATPVRPSVTINRSVPVGQVAVGGARTEVSRSSTTTWNSFRPAPNSTAAQSVSTPDRNFRSPARDTGTVNRPEREPGFTRNDAGSTSARSDVIRPREASTGRTISPTRSEGPAMRSPAMAPPIIAPASRPSSEPSRSYSPPASPPPSRSYSSPPPSSAPARSYSSPPASAPSRSGGSPDSGGGGGGSRSGGPRRQN